MFKKKTRTALKYYSQCLTVILIYSFELPKNWFPLGGESKKYEMGIDIGAGNKGDNAATIRSKKTQHDEFGTLSQICSASKFSGKRIKFSGQVKTENVTKGAGLWMRVNSTCTGEILAFDNMNNRAISGTSDWQNCEIVLSIPPTADQLVYGGMLMGAGQMWFDNLKFEFVADTMKQTGSIAKESEPVKPLLYEPANLDFEK